MKMPLQLEGQCSLSRLEASAQGLPYCIHDSHLSIILTAGWILSAGCQGLELISPDPTDLRAQVP